MLKLAISFVILLLIAAMFEGSSLFSVDDAAAMHPCVHPRLNGDVNNNHVIDESDAILTKEFALGADPSSLDLPCGAYDVDCDGDIGVSDANKIRRALRGLPYKQNEPCPDIGSVITP